MKLNDFRGEKAVELLADLMESASKIMTDKVIVGMTKDKGVTKLQLVQAMMKGHPTECLEITALLAGVDVHDTDAFEAYKAEATPVIIVRQILEAISDPDVASLFT